MKETVKKSNMNIILDYKNLEFDSWILVQTCGLPSILSVTKDKNVIETGASVK